MKLIYNGSSTCSDLTFKRLCLLADEIAFTDYPNVMFANGGHPDAKLPSSPDLGYWGSVGKESPMRKNLRFMDGKPVHLAIFQPEAVSGKAIYRAYWDADLANLRFRKEVLHGLASDPDFSRDFLAVISGKLSTEETVSAIVADESLQTCMFDYLKLQDRKQFDVKSQVHIDFLISLSFVSIALTNALVIMQEHGFVPVSDSRTWSALLALRLTDGQYIGQAPSKTADLGIEVARTVIADAVLEKIEVSDVLNYRLSTRKQYAEFSAEMDRLSMSLLDVDPLTASTEIKKLIAKEISKTVSEYTNELSNARDKMFGDLVKKVSAAGLVTHCASLSISHLFHISAPHAIAGFASTAFGVVPAVVDYAQSIRQTKRKNSMAYLVGLKPRAKRI